MPFSFALPTTGHLNLSAHLSSDTHPSLPLTATTRRGVLRLALKAHKRLPPAQRTAHLSTVQSALDGYLPPLLALDAGLSGRPVSTEEIDVVLQTEPRTTWRATLTTPPIPGREPTRIPITSFEHEVLFALHTAGLLSYLHARAALRTLFDTATPTPEQRAATIAAAMKHLLAAQSAWSYLSTRAAGVSSVPAPDIAAGTLAGLAALALAEATLAAVHKDDPWPAAVAQARNAADTDWMWRAPSLPKVRALLFARLCLAAADHAGQAHALLAGAPRLEPELVRYAADLRRACRARACRLFGLDKDADGRTGEALAWVRGGLNELGVAAGEDDGQAGSGRLARFKAGWRERREDKRIERGGEWGNDAGRLEEGRVLALLDERWERETSTVNVQAVPPFAPLVAAMPSGREYHKPAPFVLPALDERALAALREPPERTEVPGANEGDSGDEGDGGVTAPGGFPGTPAPRGAGGGYY